MKSTCFHQILNETTIEVNAGYLDTIQRLLAQEGVCRNTDAAGDPLAVYCSCDGKLTVREPSRRSAVTRSIYVMGEVVEEGGKTKVKIYEIYDRTAAIFQYIFLGLTLLAVAVELLLVYLQVEAVSTPALVGTVAAMVLVIWLRLTESRNQRKNKTVDLETMKQEIINRVKAVERWDD